MRLETTGTTNTPREGFSRREGSLEWLLLSGVLLLAASLRCRAAVATAGSVFGGDGGGLSGAGDGIVFRADMAFGVDHACERRGGNEQDESDCGFHKNLRGHEDPLLFCRASGSGLPKDMSDSALITDLAVRKVPRMEEKVFSDEWNFVCNKTRLENVL
jgi:hypothetical protein